MKNLIQKAFKTNFYKKLKLKLVLTKTKYSNILLEYILWNQSKNANSKIHGEFLFNKRLNKHV